MSAAHRGVVYLDVETTPFVLSVVAAAAVHFRRYLASRQQLADRQTLMSFGDRELKDIGLYRSDLDRVLDGGKR